VLAHGAVHARVDVVPTGAALGAELKGVDLRAIESATLQAIRDAWLAHEVLLIRGQWLDDEALITFSRHFGELEKAPIQENGRRFVEGHPEIYVVSNIVEAGIAIGSLGSGEAVWHTDMSYLALPPKASMLYGLEVPASGGETSFCSMMAAWRTLPAPLKVAIAGRRIKHDGTYNSGGYVREGLIASDDPRTAPGAYHPIVCLHPETARPALYLGRRRNAYVEGLSLAESEALLDALWAHATRPELTWEHRWRVGDLLIWDNRSTMHRRNGFDPDARRLLHRTQIRGETPPRAG